MCLIVHKRLSSHTQNNNNETQNDGDYSNNSTEKKEEYVDSLIMIGGFAGWPRDDDRWDGDRTRNDVWMTMDGKQWEEVHPPPGNVSMPFDGRAWHSCGVVSWHDDDDDGERIVIVGGGYFGTNGNNDVRTVEGHVDMWSSQDGSYWYRIDYEEGKNDNWYSTNEWTQTSTESLVANGKWGHTMELLVSSQDLNFDQIISNTSQSMEFCTSSESSSKMACKVVSVDEMKVPSLIIIGGKASHGGPIANDVFLSDAGSKFHASPYFFTK